MTLAVLERALPGYAEALKRELASLASGAGLSERQSAGCFIAAAFATRQPEVIAQTVNAFARKVPYATQIAARQAAATAAMCAPAARSMHLGVTSASDIASPLSRAIGSSPPGLDHAEFGVSVLAAWVVSGGAFNGDGDRCALRDAGIGDDATRTAIRIAAVISAIAVTLDGEAALAPPQLTSI
jgi:alkyl hydroperoxide reductase subunit D